VAFATGMMFPDKISLINIISPFFVYGKLGHQTKNIEKEQA